MSYKVQSRTTLEQYKKKENEVIRRFRDFAWLHSKLQEQNRGVFDTCHRQYLLAPKILAEIAKVYDAQPCCS